MSRHPRADRPTALLFTRRAGARADPSSICGQERPAGPEPGYGSRVPDDADSNLDQLAAAYGVDPPSVEGVANEVVGHATDTGSGAGHALTWGGNEYGAVVDVILAIVETPGVVQALADGDDIPQGFVIEAESRVWPEGRHESMPALAMVELVIADMRQVFGPDGS